MRLGDLIQAELFHTLENVSYCSNSCTEQKKQKAAIHKACSEMTLLIANGLDDHAGTRGHEYGCASMRLITLDYYYYYIL